MEVYLLIDASIILGEEDQMSETEIVEFDEWMSSKLLVMKA